MIDAGPNAASAADITLLANSLGYVLSQGSAFVLDADNPTAFDHAPAVSAIRASDMCRMCRSVRRARIPRAADRSDRHGGTTQSQWWKSPIQRTIV